MSTKLNDELLLEEVDPGYLGFFTKIETKTTLTVPIDQDFKDPSYYRHVVSAINDLSEEDIIIFEINSPGGRVDGLVTLLSALERSPAVSIAVLNGMAASAASILALSCDICLLTEYSSMMCHGTSFSTSGKSYDIQAHVSYEKLREDKLMRKAYKDFLTETEIDDILRGVELWLDAEDIEDRLTIRDALRNEEDDPSAPIEFPDLHEEPVVEEVAAKPKRKSKTKAE